MPNKMHVIGDYQLNPQRLDLPGGLTESGDLNLNQIEILINGLPSDKYHSVSQCDTKSGTLERYFLTLYKSLGGYYRNTGLIQTYTNILRQTPRAGSSCSFSGLFSRYGYFGNF